MLERSSNCWEKKKIRVGLWQTLPQKNEAKKRVKIDTKRGKEDRLPWGIWGGGKSFLVGGGVGLSGPQGNNSGNGGFSIFMGGNYKTAQHISTRVALSGKKRKKAPKKKKKGISGNVAAKCTGLGGPGCEKGGGNWGIHLIFKKVLTRTLE